MKVGIVTDSTCDLPQDLVESLNIKIIPLYINIGESGYLDGVDITRKEFYENLPSYEFHPTTGTPGVDTFKKTYQDLRQAGADAILSIHISESLSATVKIAEIAAREFNKIPVIVWDSQQLSMGTGFQVELAAKMAQDGKSVDEIIRALEDMVPRTFVTAGLDTLEFLKRSGRMNVFLAGIGSLLNLKPILTMVRGLPDSVKVRTARKAFNRMMQMLKENVPVERIALLHTNAAEKAEQFKKMVQVHLRTGKIFSMDITPVIGAHLGPGAVGFAIVAKDPIR